jgi:hypothetical protein
MQHSKPLKLLGFAAGIKSISFGACINQKSHGKRSFITGYLLMGSCPY